MLELSINSTAIVCLSLIIFATYANIADDVRSSILGGLCVVILLCLFLVTRNTAPIAIIIGIIYVSILSLFLTMSQNKSYPKWKFPKYCWLGFITLASAILIFSTPYSKFIKSAVTCSGIADITLLLASISLLVFSCIISFLGSRE